jgi:hypothetical protein
MYKVHTPSDSQSFWFVVSCSSMDACRSFGVNLPQIFRVRVKMKAVDYPEKFGNLLALNSRRR